MKMQIELRKVLDLIETKNSWGKEQLKNALLNLLADDDGQEPKNW